MAAKWRDVTRVIWVLDDFSSSAFAQLSAGLCSPDWSLSIPHWDALSTLSMAPENNVFRIAEEANWRGSKVTGCKCVTLKVSQKPSWLLMWGQLDDSHSGQAGLLFLGTGIMTDFFKGGGNHRGSEGLIKDWIKQTIKLISAGSQNTASNPIMVLAAFLTFTLFSSLRTSSSDTVITWSSLLCLLLPYMLIGRRTFKDHYSWDRRYYRDVVGNIRPVGQNWRASNNIWPTPTIFWKHMFLK